MKAYDIFRVLLCCVMIALGMFAVFMCLFSFDETVYGNFIFDRFRWNPHINIQYILLWLMLPAGLVMLRRKPIIYDLLPRVGIVFGICTIAIALYRSNNYSALFLNMGDILLGIGMIISSLSFRRGFLHASMRMLLIILILIG